MNKDEKELYQIKKDLDIFKRKVEIVEKLSDVKSYLSLKEDYMKLQNLEKDKYIKMRQKKYDKCNHQYICTSYDFDENTNKAHYTFGCVKCGFDSKYESIDDRYLNQDQLIMKYYSRFNPISGKVSMSTICDLSLAKAIYERIREVYPYLDDDKLIKYFEIALLHMRLDTNDNRKKSRIRRLNLNKDFDRW